MSNRLIRTSKFLSFVLRHRPEAIGLTLDPAGWVEVDRLIDAARCHGRPLDRALVEHVVRQGSKKRFVLSPDGRRLRAAYGHSVEVDLGLEPTAPPGILYHGTAARVVEKIRAGGLTRRNRQYVHLSPDEETARTVGQRHGSPVVLRVQAGAMHAAGHRFYATEGGIWLTEHVPPRFL